MAKELKERTEIKKKLKKKNDRISFDFSDKLAGQLRRCTADLNRLRLFAIINQLTYTIMKRVFNELTPECEITARMYAQGYEKKEIANLKCRAVSTINNQLQRAFEILNVRNGRELATMLYERIAGMKFTMDFSPTIRSAVAFCLLCIFSFSLYHEQGDMRRGRRTRVERIERTGRYGGKT